ncbi:ABC transporter permease [Streptacidiphilus rugosus]|uniref:ABC transporter permease n=1 Tax=Streptacidiphilus rugosus TaxID=405783 RepID=UPI00068A48AD|nr:ABC transporter permease [Streptacidiphilus rugosus]
MTVFFLGALGILLLLSFGTTDDLGDPRFGHTLQNLRALLHPVYLQVIGRSLAYAAITAVLCLAIAYPVAYAIALHGGRFRHALIAAVVVPFFANYLVRMYGWVTLLSDDGPVLRALRALGLPADVRLLNTPGAVIGGLVYGFVVFMVLPLYAALERLDVSLIEAGRDLGGGPFSTFWRVTLPATRQGVTAGLLLVFLPAMGDFVSAQLLGGPRQLMIGSLIQDKFFGGQDWPLGSALTMLLMLVLLICTSVYLRQAARENREASR